MAWETCNLYPRDPITCTIYARIFSSAGTPLSPAVQVASRTAPLEFGTSLYPSSLAFDPNGNLLVVWEVSRREPTASDREDIAARLLGPAGEPLGPPFLVGEPREGEQICGQVGVDDRGRWTFIWWGDGPHGFEIYARQFQGPGAPPP